MKFGKFRLSGFCVYGALALVFISNCFGLSFSILAILLMASVISYIS